MHILHNIFGSRLSWEVLVVKSVWDGIRHFSSSVQNWGLITDWEASIWSKGLGSYFTFC